MIDLRFIDELSRRVAEAMPAGAREMQRDIERNARAVLHSALGRLDLVTRDEYEIQARVLENTRAKLVMLEKQVAELEARLEATTVTPS